MVYYKVMRTYINHHSIAIYTKFQQRASYSTRAIILAVSISVV